MVTGETVRILIIVCGVPGVEEERVRKAAELARRLISQILQREFPKQLKFSTPSRIFPIPIPESSYELDPVFRSLPPKHISS
jgi:hypothetical protein